jgi:hypothetical protein
LAGHRNSVFGGLKNVAEGYMRDENDYVYNKFDTSRLLLSLKNYSENYSRDNNIKIDTAFEKSNLQGKCSNDLNIW